MSNEEKRENNISWTLSETADRIRGKVLKHKAQEYSTSDLVDYKTEGYAGKEKQINQAWEEHDKAAQKAKNRASNLTAKQISDYMKKENS